jgi:hypothetical protein
LTLQKINSTRHIILICVFIFTIGIILGFAVYPCGIQHIVIMDNLKSYEKSLDPEFCNIIVEKINSFNSECKPEIELLDCG